MTLHVIYLLFIYLFIYKKVYVDDPFDKFEIFLWTVCFLFTVFGNLGHDTLVLISVEYWIFRE